MASGKAVSGAARVFGALLAGATLFMTLLVTAMMSDLGGSDAAGNGMAEGFTALGLFLLFGLLAALALVATLAGDMPRAGRIATLVLVPASFGAIWIAFTLLTHPKTPPGLWPLAIPAAAPPLIIFYCLWSLFASWRAAIPARGAMLVVWGGVGLLCLAAWPLSATREAVNRAEAERQEAWTQKLAATPADAPLERWTPFLTSHVYLVEQAAREKILKLPSRQADAEAMLDRDEFPFGQLSQFDLDPTPTLCAKAREALARRAARLLPAPQPPPGFAQIADEFGAATEAMTWLVGFACPCEQESLAWEKLARAYGAEDYDVAGLVKLRDPKELGHILYNDPPKFSMLTPKASLRAWLSFASGPGGIGATPQAAEALAGAKSLDHRTGDAVAWLNDPYAREERFVLIRYLPELDLDPTPALCAAALAALRDDIARTYRPTADNPPPYSELLERLGAGQPLEALKWLAAHGCDADAELAAAADLTRSYDDSPDRAAMLAAFDALRRRR